MTSQEPDSPEHESKCERCGIACRAAAQLPDGKQVVIQHLDCVHLTTSKGDGRPACAVYEERFEKAPWCLHSEKASPLGALRQGCPYQKEGDPRGKEIVGEEEYAQLWPKIAEVILRSPNLNVGFTWKKFCAEATKKEPGWTWRAEFNAPKTRVTVTREKSFWSKLWAKGEI